MPVLIIGPTEQSAISSAIETARKSPIQLGHLIAGATIPAKAQINLADRKPGFERPPSQHVILGTYRAAISFEEQPNGLCQHLSISTMKPGTLPPEIVLAEIAKEFGFTAFPPAGGKVWLEEFDPGHYAVNIVEHVK